MACEQSSPPIDDGESSDTGPGSSSTTGTEPCPVGMNGCPCTGGGACDPGLVCNESLVCEQGAADASASTSGETTASASGETGTSEGETSGEETTVAPPECVDEGTLEENKDCKQADRTRPFCEDGACVACKSDKQCADATTTLRPICQMDGENAGACVECNATNAIEAGQCDEERPHCNLDLDKYTCEGCLEHSECPGTACDVKQRKCFPQDRVLYVRYGPAPNQPCTFDVNTGGGPGNPYCDMATAIASAQIAGKTSGWTFVIMSSKANIDQSPFSMSGGGDTQLAYAMVHEPGTLFDTHTTFLGFGPVVTVNSGVRLYMVDFTVRVENMAWVDGHFGISCNEDAEIWLDDSRVLYSRGPGIRANGCDIHLRRSSIAFGRSEGIEINGGSLQMLNSFIDENGSNEEFGGGGIRMSGGAVAEVVYSTLANNVNTMLTGEGDTVHCDGPVTLDIRNSIFAHGPNTGNNSIVCAEGQISVSNSVVDGDFGNEGNNHKLAAETILMSLFPSSNDGTYRIPNIMAAEEFRDRAVWRYGDPRQDFERQDRNAFDGMADFAGADYFPED